MKVRGWVRDQARESWDLLKRGAGMATEGPDHATTQIDAQLQGFPEVCWSAVPWSLVETDGKGKAVADQVTLRTHLERLFPGAEGEGAGGSFLDGPAWQQVLSREVAVEGVRFFEPNPGVLYPALHQLVDRCMSGAKSLRPFEALPQRGYRCSLCGEREWLAAGGPEEVAARPGTSPEPWAGAAQRRRSWLGEGERLCALCLTKRLWPTRFAQEISGIIGANVSRYVVSTHAMALVPALRRLVEEGARGDPRHREGLQRLVDEVETEAGNAFMALPERLAGKLRGGEFADTARALPGVLDILRERRLGEDPVQAREAVEQERQIRRGIRELTGVDLGSYYALVLMDGDRMGAWLSGEECQVTLGELWHPRVRARMQAPPFGDSEAIERYVGVSRPPSPSYHAAVSRALNSFAIHLAPEVVERCFDGKVLYAGGDDLLAMTGIDDLLAELAVLRSAYSGVFDSTDRGAVWTLLEASEGERPTLGGGHALIGSGARRRLLRLMGERATASMGVVVAHSMAPMQTVLRELRAAERRAKNEGGRDAFSITLMKRAGGTRHFTAGFRLGEASTLGPSPLGVLMRLQRLLARHVSRRAAYHLSDWTVGLPTGGGEREGDAAIQDMLQTLIAYQLDRQTDPRRPPDPGLVEGVSRDLATLACCTREGRPRRDPPAFVREALNVAEFLARGEPDRQAGGDRARGGEEAASA